mgnify:CR=1 FL=1
MTSVAVVKNTELEIAGSILNLSNVSGIKVPKIPANNKFAIIAKPIINAICLSPNHKYANKTDKKANITPLTRPTHVSLKTNFC